MIILTTLALAADRLFSSIDYERLARVVQGIVKVIPDLAGMGA